MSCRHPKSSTTSDGALQGSTVMRQSSAETLVTEEPYELIAHVRICGGAGRVTAGPTRKPTRRSARLMPGVCAVHAVMLGSESLLSRCTWSRRTREAQGRHREVGSEGSVERTCGARDTNRIRGVVQLGRAGTQPQSPPSTMGLCFINPASMHGRYDSLPREICGVSEDWTEGGAILPDRPAEVSRRHSRRARAR